MCTMREGKESRNVMKTKAAEVEYVFFLQQIKERDYKPLPSLILSRLNNRHGDIP